MSACFARSAKNLSVSKPNCSILPNISDCVRTADTIELGEDFSILGRQVPLKIDTETHSIDMVLYHRGIPCAVLVDLKIGKLDSRDIGQMIFIFSP
jgi:hypothetical protein